MSSAVKPVTWPRWAAPSVLLALSACGGGYDPQPIPLTPTAPPLILPAGNEAGGAGSPTDPLTRFVNTGRFELTANYDLQRMAVTLGNFDTAIADNPSAAFQRSTTGFNIEFGGSTTPLRYDTRVGSIHLRDTTGYRNCTNECIGSGLGQVPIITTFSSSPSLSYALYGEWATRPLVGFTGFSMFATGIASLATQVPTTGSATYIGTAIGATYSNRQSTDGPQRFSGDISLSANFSGRTISGSVTNIRSVTVYSGLQNTFGDISLTGGTFAGSSFAGIATGSPSPANNPEQLAGSTGVFGGRFYGPNSEEVAGTFNLKNPMTNLIGSFGAKR